MTSPAAPCVSVLVDDSGRVGPLSYLVPSGMRLEPGMAVHVPFGRRELHGMVLGPGDPAKANREVLRVYGIRAAAADIDVAARLAARHFATLVEVASRLSPSTARDAQPLDPGEVRLAEPAVTLPGGRAHRSLLLASPCEDQAALAAAEAQRLTALAPGAQVLVLCPTRNLVEQVLARFASGAVRLDAQAPTGAWSAFVSGAAPVAVGSRAAALYSAARLGGIVVVEADHPGHREATQPYWDSVEVARERATAHHCALTVLSAAPVLRHLKSLKVAPTGTRHAPRVRVVNVAALPPSQRHTPPQLSAAAARARSAGLEMLAVSGGASERVCVRCGDHRPCGMCDEPACQHRETRPCPTCSSVGVRWSGLSSELASRRFGADRALGLDDLAALSRADRVIVVPDADRFLSTGSLDGDAHAYRNLVRMARAAGPGGELVVCTRQADHPALQALRALDPRALLEAAWETARTMNLPPHRHLLTVRVNADTAPRVGQHPGILFGPRRRGREWELMLTFAPDEHDDVARLVARLRRRGKVRVALL